jgi:photosystem II PsbJ protein
VILLQLYSIFNQRFKKIMSDIGRVPLWMVATIGGLAALGLLSLFFFGSYSGLGSAL